VTGGLKPIPILELGLFHQFSRKRIAICGSRSNMDVQRTPNSQAADATFSKNEDIEALRAIAVLLAVSCHLGDLFKPPGTHHSLFRLTDFWGGVDIFFCVSSPDGDEDFQPRLSRWAATNAATVDPAKNLSAVSVCDRDRSSQDFHGCSNATRPDDFDTMSDIDRLSLLFGQNESFAAARRDGEANDCAFR